MEGFDSASCTSTTTYTAIGSETGTTAGQWNAPGWSPEPTPQPEITALDAISYTTGGFCLPAGSPRNLGPLAEASPNRATRPSIASRLGVARWSRGSASPPDVLLSQRATRDRAPEPRARYG